MRCCGERANRDPGAVRISSGIRVVVPRFDHYILYDQSDLWRKYLRSIIETFDDSHVLPTLAATTGGGALLNEKDRGQGATAGFLIGLAGLILDSVTKP